MKFKTKTISDMSADTVICFIFEDYNKKSELFNYLNSLSNGELERQIEYGCASAKYMDATKIAVSNGKKVLLFGLGKLGELTRKRYSVALANAARIAKKLSKNETLAFELIDNSISCDNKFTKKEAVIMALPALRIGLYDYDKYLLKKKPKIETIEIIEQETTPEIEQGAQIGAYTSYAMKFAKDLVNEPAQYATPAYIAQLSSQIADECDLECKIYNREQLREMGMNAFLAVGQGSINEPRFIHLTYKPMGKPRKKVALVGKGITFDAGGMNIKSAASMLTMKSDMSGAASVLGIIQAMAKIDADVEVHAISALCENMTSGSAYKQGDILVAMNGKSIEVDNTDAEGRITLADALSYCDRLDVDEVIGIATLTGAVIPALGNNITAVLGNNQAQIDKFKEIAAKSCENVWQMPILDELKDNLKSEIADFKNTGGRNAGTSTAAWFLSNFTQSKSWLHLDIAGTAYLEKSNKETVFGPTGVMVRSLINYLLA